MSDLTRDKLKDSIYFDGFLSGANESIALRGNYIEDETTKETKVKLFRKQTLEKYLHIAIALYSMGKGINTVKQQYLAVLTYMAKYECWTPIYTKPTLRDGSQLNSYIVEEHGTMLRLLALGVLLKISKAEFSILVNIIDRDKVVDNLYEFFIKAYFPERKQTQKEIYNLDKSTILKVYQKLRDAILLDSVNSTDEKLEAESLVKGFLQKGFYHKHSGFHNDHKYEPVKLYYGYWSFEAAAVTCLMGLDDKSYRKHKYYPVDLADYYREQSE